MSIEDLFLSLALLSNLGKVKPASSREILAVDAD